VFLDYASWAAKNNIAINAFSFQGIPASHLQQLADEEGISFQQGDILFVRSGFTAQYEALSPEDESERPEQCIGLESSVETARWLWENGFSAVAGDAPGFEQTPLWDTKVRLHEWCLAGWGMPLGEMFYLEELAKVLKEQKRNTFFVTSVPLKIIGGVASPPNAMAIL
jgi:kynurenine formamidase